MEDTFTKSILLEFVIGKKWRLLRHIGMLTFFAILFYPNIDHIALKKLSPINNTKDIIEGLRKASLISFLIALFFIYLNLLVLVPKYLLKNKLGIYIFLCFLSTVCIYISDVLITKKFLFMVVELKPLAENSIKNFVDSAFLPIIFLAASAGYEIFKKWVIDSALLAELKQNKVEQELTNLKNQMNPHFLFNTLNNLHTLINVNPTKASSVVLGLSDVLRYQLYESNEDKVMLKKDIQVLQQYLELEKIRRDNFQFSINVNELINGVFIPPFIFINFVENAIKHSLDNEKFSFIALNFTVNNGVLYFESKNSKPEVVKVKVNGGLGLKNIRRRLELIYGHKHTLEIKEDLNEFIIELSVPI